jgi:hypothetical protein
MTIIDAPKRKSSENPNLHNYTPKSRTSRQVHIEKEWRPSRAEVDLYCKEEPAVRKALIAAIALAPSCDLV